MKIKYLFASIFLLASVSSFGADKSIDLMCKLETGVDMRYSIDLERKTLTLTNFKISLDIEVTDKELIHEKYHNGTLLSKVRIDRFSLESTQYDALKLSGKQWINGKCEILKKQF